MARLVKYAAAIMIAGSIALTGCSSGAKPSKEEVTKVVIEVLPDKSEHATKAATCITDKIYDKVSAAFLNALVKKDNKYKPTSDEEKALTEAMTTCSKELMGG